MLLFCLYIASVLSWKVMQTCIPFYCMCRANYAIQYEIPAIICMQGCPCHSINSELLLKASFSAFSAMLLNYCHVFYSVLILNFYSVLVLPF